MKVCLVHHADAVGPHVDPQRPLSAIGCEHVERLATDAKAAGIRPAVIWHSGKLRARQTAEAFYRICNPFAEFKMVRGLLPEDPPQYARDLLAGETRDVMLVGHLPNLRDVLQALAPATPPFPLHGLVALQSMDEGVTWTEAWRRG